MNSKNVIEVSDGVQDNAGRSLSQTPPKALLRKNQQWMSGLKKTLMDRYKDDMRKEKKIYNDKKLKKNKEEPTQSTEAAPPFHPALKDSRNVKEFQYLNKIDEGAYGVVYRARDKATDEIVALKRLKALNEKEGFSIAAQRELRTLLKIQHPNIVAGREIAVGSRRNHVYVVMEYVPHQLRTFLETMRQNHLMFSPEHIKCLMIQLLTATQHLHDNNIIHRDLKTNNILLAQNGVLKVADFGLAREYECPPQQYTPGVVTRWYRAPELLLLSPQYSTPIDMWSIGCILGELINLWPLFPGTSELDQLNRIFLDLGTPSDSIWPGYSALPAMRNIIFDDYPPGGLRKQISCKDLSESGLSLLEGLLTYDPARRLTAAAALDHEYFTELPLAIEPARFPIAMESVDSGQYSATELEEDRGSHYSTTLSALDNDVLNNN
uniref:cyclin-dependent kinase n=1 Tax=Spodoptera frugiperda TaxID=7108 RepID=A0A2H1VUN2_SPOFR